MNANFFHSGYANIGRFSQSGSQEICGLFLQSQGAAIRYLVLLEPDVGMSFLKGSFINLPSNGFMVRNQDPVTYRLPLVV